MKTRLLYALLLLILATLLLNACNPAIYSPLKLYEKDGKLMGILPLENGKVVYKEKVSVPELPKEEVFRRARRWCVLAYRSAKDVLQLVDKETGEIIGKGYSTVDIKQVYHTITVDVHEDDYEITVRDLDVHIPSLGTGIYAVPDHHVPIEKYNLGTEKTVIDFFRNLDNDITTTIASLRSYVKSPNR